MQPMGHPARDTADKDVRNPNVRVDAIPADHLVSACFGGRDSRDRMIALGLRVTYARLEERRLAMKDSQTRLFTQKSRVAPLACPPFRGFRTARVIPESSLTMTTHDLQCLVKVLFELDLLPHYPMSAGVRPPLPLCSGTPE